MHLVNNNATVSTFFDHSMVLNPFVTLQHEAAKVMTDAIHEFQGTPEEIR